MCSLLLVNCSLNYVTTKLRLESPRVAASELLVLVLELPQVPALELLSPPASAPQSPPVLALEPLSSPASSLQSPPSLSSLPRPAAPGLCWRGRR